MSDNRLSQFAATVDNVDTEAGTIAGIAVKYNTPVQRMPRVFEEVRPGAFKAQIADPARVLVLWQHDGDNPIGRNSAFRDSDEMLRFRAKISEHDDLPTARKALALLREGIIDEISVGFEWGTWAEEQDEETDTTTIVHTKARLRELSVVTFGALGQDARVVSVADNRESRIDLDTYRARLAGLHS